MSGKKIIKKRLVDKLSLDSVYIDAESAQEAKSIAYGCRWLIMATMPYRKTEEESIKRKNGNLSIRYIAGEPGLPYGPKPRLIGTWLETEMVRKRERTIKLGETFTDFIEKLGFKKSHGGRLYSAIRDQSCRLFASTIQISQQTKNSWEHKTLPIAPDASLWWSSDSPKQIGLFDSKITVGEEYFKEVIARPVPLDMRALAALKGSALALDIYRWYASRLCLVPGSEPAFIHWDSIQNQLGADYKDNKLGRNTFRKFYRQQHKKVSLVYSEAKVDFVTGGLILHCSPPPVHSRNRTLPRPKA